MQLDVNELLSDPDVGGERFVVVRRFEKVNGFGERENGTEYLNGVGSVYPTAENDLVREEAYQQGLKTIQVVTAIKLRMAGLDGSVRYDPDLIKWQNDFYLVKHLEDFSRYGAGMTSASCLSTDYIEQVPITKL